MTDVKVFLGGEGPNELGGRVKESMYRDPSPEPGVLEALLRQINPGFTVTGALVWKRITKR